MKIMKMFAHVALQFYRNALVPCIASVLFVLSAMPLQSAEAEEGYEPGFYIGAGYGASEFIVGGLESGVDDNSHGPTVYGGYDFNHFLQLEAQWTDYGKFTISGDASSTPTNGDDPVPINAEVTSLGVLALFKYNKWKYKPFATLGVQRTNIKYSATGIQSSDSDTGPFTSLGVLYVKDAWHIRAEFNAVEIESNIGGIASGEQQVNYLLIGVAYKF